MSSSSRENPKTGGVRDGDPPWYDINPRGSLEWAQEFLVDDLLKMAARARADGEFQAQVLEGKASLLRAILNANLSAADTSEANDKGPGMPNETSAPLSKAFNPRPKAGKAKR